MVLFGADNRRTLPMRRTLFMDDKRYVDVAHRKRHRDAQLPLDLTCTSARRYASLPQLSTANANAVQFGVKLEDVSAAELTLVVFTVGSAPCASAPVRCELLARACGEDAEDAFDDNAATLLAAADVASGDNDVAVRFTAVVVPGRRYELLLLASPGATVSCAVHVTVFDAMAINKPRDKLAKPDVWDSLHLLRCDAAGARAKAPSSDVEVVQHGDAPDDAIDVDADDIPLAVPVFSAGGDDES
jgi:hypothetical protein